MSYNSPNRIAARTIALTVRFSSLRRLFFLSAAAFRGLSADFSAGLDGAGRLVGGGGLLVRFAAIVGRVKTGTLEDDRPPGPISRRSFFLPHSGHCFLASSLIDWNSSNCVLAGIAHVIIGRHVEGSN